MLTPRQLEKMPFDIMRIVNGFQNKIIEYIATDLGKFDEFKIIDEFNETNAENIQNFNVYYQREKKRTKKRINTKIEDIILLFMISDVLSESECKKNNIPHIPFKEDKYLNKITDSTIKGIQKDIDNTFNNLGFNGKALKTGKTINIPIKPTQFKPISKQQGFYQKIMDRTTKDIFNVKVDYNTAIRNAVRAMTNNGIRDIQYPAHTDRIDVAVRRSIMTQLKVLSRKSEEYKAKRLGLTTFEITWHPQHRDSHGWGGRRFSKVTTNDIDIQTGKPFLLEQELYEEYPSPKTGEVGTLEDWNCYHSIFYVYPFDEPLFSQKDLNQKNKEQEETKDYKGEEYTQWQVRERQRTIERTIRDWRLRAKGYERSRQEEAYMKSRAKLKTWRNEYREFCEHFGLKTEWERIYYDDLGRV